MPLDPSRRRLGTESGRMRREARRIERAGGDPSRMLEAASEQKLKEGSSISAAEGNMRREQYLDRLQRGQMELARRSVLGTASSTPTPAATPAPTALSRPPATRSVSAPMVTGTAAPATTTTPAPISRINGQPARTVLDQMRRRPEIEPSFGRDAAAAMPPAPAAAPGNMQEVRQQKADAVKKASMQPALAEARKRRDPSAISSTPPVWPPRPHLR